MFADLRLGLVGCGQVAALGYLPALGRARGLRLTAVADPVQSRCRELAPAVPAYPDARSMIAAGVIDAIVLATPAATHLTDARQAAAAGLPALVEKPPALNAEDAAALARLNPRPFVGFNRRFDPLLQRLRAGMPAAGSLSLSLDLHYESGAWRPHMVDDDALLSVGTHRDRPRSVADQQRRSACESTPADTHSSRDRTRPRPWHGARLVCDRPATARPDRRHQRLRSGRCIPRWCWSDVEITCPLDDGARQPFASADPSGITHAARPSPDSRARIVRHRLRRPQSGGRSPVVVLATAADGLAVMTVVDAARRSAREDGSWQSLPSGAWDQRSSVALGSR